MEILIKNQQIILKLNLKKKKEIVIRILKYLGIVEKIEVSILFTNDELIKELNSQYRGINKATDVLSFCFEDTDSVFPMVGKNKILGDIIISVETARKQASELKHDIDREITTLLIHGLLHLLKYNHIEDEDYEIMHKKESEIFNYINNEPLGK